MSLKHFILFYPEFDVIPHTVPILTNIHSRKTLYEAEDL